jgi:hypothetical protein
MPALGIPDLLDAIVAHLLLLGRRSPALLQPPLTPVELRRWEARFPFAFTSEIEAAYSWRNGTKADEGDLLDNLHFFPGFYFLSMQEAHQTYLERRDAPQWQEGWFPLFADGGGDFYLVSCRKRKLNRSPIIGFINGEPEQVEEYESAAAMLATLEAAFAESAFFIDKDDTLEIDDDMYAQIAARFNPGISEWQS